MDMRHRVWTYERPGISGVWVGWYEGARRRAKSFDTTTLAERYASTKREQLAAGVSGEIVALDWPELLAEYRQSREAADGLRPNSLYETMLTLRHWERLIGPVRSMQITQVLLERFIKARTGDTTTYGKRKRGTDNGPISLSTLNKDIRNIKTFLRWCVGRGYISPDVKFTLKPRRVQQAPVVPLSPDQVKTLLATAAKESPAWFIRVLLAVVTGLRRSDIEVLRVADIHFDRGTIATQSHKTGKALGERPVPARVMVKLGEYRATLNGQEKLFADRYTSKKWDHIRDAAGLSEIRFHDLRKTFASMLAQRGVATAVTQRLLEHATAKLTNDVYTNVDPVLRDAVDRLDSLVPGPLNVIP
jgi:integrase